MVELSPLPNTPAAWHEEITSSYEIALRWADEAVDECDDDDLNDHRSAQLAAFAVDMAQLARGIELDNEEAQVRYGLEAVSAFAEYMIENPERFRDQLGLVFAGAYLFGHEQLGLLGRDMVLELMAYLDPRIAGFEGINR